LPKDPNEIGALWTKTSKSGSEYFSGTVNGQAVVVFKNSSDNPKAPQWRVLKSLPKANTSTPSEADDFGL